MATYTNSDQTGKKGLRWALVGLAVVVMLITGAVLLSSGGGKEKEPSSSNQDRSSSAKESAGRFISALLVADGPASFDLMSERLQKQLGSSNKWNIFLKSNFGGGKELIALAGTEEIQNSGDPKPLRLTYNVGGATNRTSRKIELVMRHIKDSWKVDEFALSNEES